MKKLFFLLLVALMAVGLSGCGTVQRLLKTDSTTSFGGLLQNTSTAGTKDQTPTAPVISGDAMTVTMYFADSTGQKLVEEKRQIPKTLSLARETLNELFKGPAAGSELLAVVPDGTTLLDINIKNETAIVDISKEITEPLANVPSSLSVNAIVDTLTQFPTVKQVKFRVEGQAVAKIGDTSVVEALSGDTSKVEVHPITQQPISGDASGLLPAGS